MLTVENWVSMSKRGRSEDFPLLFEDGLYYYRRKDQQAKGLTIRAHLGCVRIQTLLNGLLHQAGIEI